MVESARRFTPEEYLDLEADAEFRSHYDAGIITPKPGGTVNHNRICGNCLCLLSLALKGQDYEVFAIDLKLWIPKHQKFRYSNLMVIAGEPEFYKDYKTAISNPQIIIEVLPETFEQENKFNLYKSISTLQEYLSIDQNRIAIDHFYKTQPKHWQIDQFDEQDTEIQLRSVDVKLAIADLYDKVQF